MSKVYALMYSVIVAISVLLTTYSEKVVGDGFTTEDGGETVLAVYQTLVCKHFNPECTTPDVWQVTILWQDGVRMYVNYEKIGDNNAGTTLYDAKPIIMQTTGAGACMRNVIYCPKGGGGR